MSESSETTYEISGMRVIRAVNRPLAAAARYMANSGSIDGPCPVQASEALVMPKVDNVFIAFSTASLPSVSLGVGNDPAQELHGAFFEQSGGLTVMVAVDLPARWVGRVASDAGQLQRSGIAYEDVSRCVIEYHGLSAAYSIQLVSSYVSGFTQFVLVVAATVYPVAGPGLLNSPCHGSDDIGDGAHRVRAHIQLVECEPKG